MTPLVRRWKMLSQWYLNRCNRGSAAHWKLGGFVFADALPKLVDFNTAWCGPAARWLSVKSGSKRSNHPVSLRDRWGLVDLSGRCFGDADAELWVEFGNTVCEDYQSQRVNNLEDRPRFRDQGRRFKFILHNQLRRSATGEIADVVKRSSPAHI